MDAVATRGAPASHGDGASSMGAQARGYDRPGVAPVVHAAPAAGTTMDRKLHRTDADGIARDVAAFYERHPYPAPIEGLGGYRQHWDGERRRADARLFWQGGVHRDDRGVLAACSGSSHAANDVSGRVSS